MRTAYKQIFHHLYGIRARLRRHPVVVYHVGKQGFLALNALRALGVKPLHVVSPNGARIGSVYHGLIVHPVQTLASLDLASTLIVIAADDCVAARAQLAAVGVPDGDHLVWCAGLPEVPPQALSPMLPSMERPAARARLVRRQKQAVRWLYRIVPKLSKAIFVAHFVCCQRGWQYGVTRRDKLRLAVQVFANRRHFQSLSLPTQHLMMIHELFGVPNTTRGDVVECGCFDGASTASLSLACRLVGRTLWVCDSFEGLPEPEQHEATTIRSGASFYRWKKGEFASAGGLDGVRRNVGRYGCLDVCRFVRGYFCDTLPDLPADSLVMVFEDADLRSSARDCLTSLWPRLQYGCRFFSHEPWSVDVVSLFYDHDFWRSTFGCPPPGFYGGDMGGFRSLITYFKLGYAIKRDFQRIGVKGKSVRICGSL